MKILILENTNYLVESKDKPIIGRHYSLEDSVSGTQAQNKAFHALITEYYKSGMHSYDKVDLKQFKKLIKKNLGAGFESYAYATISKINGVYKPIMHDCIKFYDIPIAVRLDPDYKQMIRGKLKSWSDYTKKERMKTMDNLISEMHQVGVNTKKFMEILEGMEEKNEKD